MEKKIFYVAQDGIYGHSGVNPQPSAGKRDGPLCFNLNYLKDIVNEDNIKGKLYEYEFIFRGGTYYINKPWVLMPHNGGKITFKAYENEEVIISGGKKITGFCEETVNGIKMLAADVPEAKCGEWNFRELYVNKRFAERPSYPADGTYLRIKSTPGNPLDGDWQHGMSFFETCPGDLDALGDLDGAEILVTHYWVEERMPIVRYDRNAHTVYCDRRSGFQLRDDVVTDYAKYRVENVFSELKEPGQWYLDCKIGKLYYIPRDGETAENILVEAPVLTEILRLAGGNGKFTEGITFENIVFENTASDNNGQMPPRTAHMFYDTAHKYASSCQAAVNINGAVRLESAKNCAFSGCTFRNIGNYAVQIGNSCERIEVRGCEFYGCGAGGIRIDGGDYFESEGLATGYNCITDNKIHDCTKIFYSAIGIFIMNGFSNYIARNEIYNLKYTGISCGWVWGFTKSRACDNVIEYNHIHHLGTGDMSDMGGIYMLGPQGGSEIRGNCIHDIKKANYGGWGIYLDEGSSCIVAEKNLVYNTDSEALFINYGKENMIRYNILSAGKNATVGIGRTMSHNAATFIQNIFVFGDKPAIFGRSQVHFEDKTVIFDCNYYCGVQRGEPTVTVGEPGREDNKIFSWDEWCAMGYDAGSHLVSDIFDAGSFELKKDAEVFGHGFKR